MRLNVTLYVLCLPCLYNIFVHSADYIPVFTQSNAMLLTLYTCCHSMPTTMLFALQAVLNFQTFEFCTQQTIFQFLPNQTQCYSHYIPAATACLPQCYLHYRQSSTFRHSNFVQPALSYIINTTLNQSFVHQIQTSVHS
jgi:hypothetical protein